MDIRSTASRAQTKSSDYVGREDTTEAGGIHLIYAYLLFENAGVVHQADELAEVFVAGLKEAYDIGRDGDVSGDSDGFGAGRFQFRNECLGLLPGGLVIDADGMAALGCEAGGSGTECLGWRR